MLRIFKDSRFIFFVLMVIGIIGMCLVIANFSSQTGKDYTKEYGIYKEVKDYTNLSELREKLQDSKIEYTVTHEKVTLEKYDNISFSVDSNSSCIIDANQIMRGFCKLDGESLDGITISGINMDGKITEVSSYEDDNNVYRKINNKYYKLDLNVIWFILPSTFIAGIFGTLLVISIYRSYKRNKKNKTQIPQIN